MLAAIDPYSIGTTLGLVVAGVLAAFSRRKVRRLQNGDGTDGKLDRIDERLVIIDRRAVRTERKLDVLARAVDQHIQEHTRR